MQRKARPRTEALRGAGERYNILTAGNSILIAGNMAYNAHDECCITCKNNLQKYETSMTNIDIHDDVYVRVPSDLLKIN
ncbi:MAG: hypothetical protein LBQ31_02490 [Bacteroidales bacterium]|nr:hypothetical protein [Bacteroidales bacterium]